jgi:hypothetical protein
VLSTAAGVVFLSLPLTDGVDSLEGLVVKPSMAQACPRAHALPEWVKRVGFVISAISPVYPKQQTFSDPVGTSHLCHERKSFEFQLITLSARAMTLSGIVRPSDAAVLRFTPSSKTVGCSTGSSAGSAPLKILSTYCANLIDIVSNLGP